MAREYLTFNRKGGKRGMDILYISPENRRF